MEQRLKGLNQKYIKIGFFIYLKLHPKVDIELDKDNTGSKEALSEGKNNNASQAELSSIFHQVQ